MVQMFVKLRFNYIFALCFSYFTLLLFNQTYYFFMNKSELISSIAEKSGLSKADSKKALDAFIESVTETLKANDKVILVGFGTFSVAERAAREGVNPSTKQKIQIPAKKVAKFKPGADLDLTK